MHILNFPNEMNKNDEHSRFLFFLIICILLSTTLLRIINLDADPVPGYTGELGYQIDEGYKTLSPRNLYLYGKTHWNTADEYPGWMKSSAMTQWPYYLSFKILGEKLSSARTVSIIYAITFLIFAALFLWQRLPHKLAALGVLLLATDPALFLFSRSALFETSIIFYVYTGIFISAAFSNNFKQLAFIPLIIIAVLSFFYLKKSVMLYLMPLAISYGFVSIKDKFNPALTKRSIISVLIILLLISATLYLNREGSSTNINLEEFIYQPQTLFLNPVHTLSPLALILAYTIIIELLIIQPKFILNDWYRLSLAALVVLVPIMLSFFTYNAARYHLPILPAAFLLIVERLSLNITEETKSQRSWLSINKALAVVVFLSLTMTLLATINYYFISQMPFNIGDDPGISDLGLLKIFPFFFLFFAIFTFYIAKQYWYKISNNLYKSYIVLHVLIGFIIAITALTFPSYQSQHIRNALTQHLKHDESVGGDWAPFFVANTKLRGLYMRPDWNNADRLEILQPNYFLHSDTPYDRKNFNTFKSLNNVKLTTPVILGDYANHKITLYSIKYSKSSEPMKTNLD